MYKIKYALIFCLFFIICYSAYGIDDKTEEKLTSMLYPTVKIGLRNFGSGSGVVIKSWKKEEKYHAYILTAEHVFRGYHRRNKYAHPKKIPCELARYDKYGYKIEHFICMGHLQVINKDLDFVILEISGGKKIHKSATSYFKKDYALFDKIYVTGFPLGTLRIGDGHISKLPSEEIFIQHDGNIWYGNSGGPLFNNDYKLIGINVQIELDHGLPLSYIGKSVPLVKIKEFLGEEQTAKFFKTD